MKTKYTLFLAIICTLFQGSLKSQDSTYKAHKYAVQKPVNLVHFEMLGPGGLYSVNYERITTEKLVLRGGFSYVNTNDSFIEFRGVSFPISVSKLFNTDNDSFVEIGAFTTISTIEVFDVWVGPSFGFREQNLTRGNGVVKLFFSPFYSIGYNEFVPTGGLSFGRSF